MPVLETAAIISSCTAAFKVLKAGVQAGKDIEDMGTQLGAWAQGISDLNYVAKRAKNPGLLSSFSRSAEAEAAEIFANQKKIQGYTKELHVLIRHQWGPKGFEEYLELTRQIRAQREATVHQREELKRLLVNCIIGLLFAAIGIGLLAGIVWLVLWKDGKI